MKKHFEILKEFEVQSKDMKENASELSNSIYKNEF